MTAPTVDPPAEPIILSPAEPVIIQTVDQDTPDSIAPWAAHTVTWSAAALFLAGVGMSGYLLSQLAVAFDVAYPWAVLLPIALDAAAVVGVVLWIGAKGGPEEFGRRLSRQLITASVIGNGLERAITFGPEVNGPNGAPLEGIPGVLARVVALIRNLTDFADPILTLATWGLLLVSVAIGVVFPLLAYRMAHALLLARATLLASRPARPSWSERRAARKAAQAAERAAQAVEEQTADPVEEAAADPVEEETATTWDEPVEPVEVKSLPPRPRPQPVRPQLVEQVPAPLPYVHDPRDLEPHTPEWTDRYNRLPGMTKTAKCAAWIEHERREGREPTGSQADKVVDGNRTAVHARRQLAGRPVYSGSDDAEESAGMLAGVS